MAIEPCKLLLAAMTMPAPALLVSAQVAAVIEAVARVRVAAEVVDTATVAVAPQLKAGTVRLVPARAKVVVCPALGPSAGNSKMSMSKRAEGCKQQETY
jgi:hypothetical protein